MRTDFSIRKLLMEEPGNKQSPVPSYHWLTTSRYNPPKLIRLKKCKKRASRKNSRTPRIPFSSSQVRTLEQKFRNNPYLSGEEAAHLSSLLRISDTRVKIWFQNRRARERRSKGNILQKQEPMIIKEPCSKTVQHGVWSAFHPVCPNIFNQIQYKS